MKTLHGLLLLGLGSMTVTSQGAWVLLQNFEEGLEGFDITKADGGFGEQMLVEDALEPGNTAYYLESGGYGVDHMNTTFSALTLPSPINEGEMATIFFRYRNDGIDNDFHFTVSDVPKTTDESGNYITPGSWGDMEAVFRLTNDGVASVRDGPNYLLLGTGTDADSFEALTVETQTWYNIWMVVDNAEGSGFDHTNFYIQGGEFAQPTLLYAQQVDPNTNEPNGDYSADVYFRNGTTDPLVNVFIGTQSGWMDSPYLGDTFYLDDIFYVAGELTESPLDGSTGELWKGYPVQTYDNGTRKWVETGSWMGGVEITASPYIYIYKLTRWAYVSESGDAAHGSWLYLFK